MSNTRQLPKINYNKVDPTFAVGNYISKRLKKKKLEGVETEWFIVRDAKKGANRFIVKLKVGLKNTHFYFSERGKDIYHLIDAVMAKMHTTYANQSSNYKYNIRSHELRRERIK